MAKSPKAVEIRSYQVGFGDCFLLSFVYGERERRHVLIDFGTTGLRPNGPKVAAHMRRVADDIATVCGGRLTGVVATHRHADHISGFGTDTRTGKSGEVIKALRPRVVVQPWTEDPHAARDATRATRDSSRSPKSFIAGLAAMDRIAGLVTEIAARPPAWMSADLRDQLMFLGMDNIKNKSAVDNLIAMGRAKGATHVFAHHGSRSGFERLLPGVKVRVLGPPDLTQTDRIRRQRSKDPDQFWHLLAGSPMLQMRTSLAGPVGERKVRGGSSVPIEARWFIDRLNRIRGSQLLEIVRTLDQQMNNTSVILLFEACGKKLLFPGDAQIENWSYALEDAPDARQTLRLLRDVDVYKVGHHGSLNATPKQLLWENFAKRDRSLHTLLSTLSGKHGRTRSRTEVPRRTLMDELEKTDLLNTQKLRWGKEPVLSHKLTVER